MYGEGVLLTLFILKTRISFLKMNLNFEAFPVLPLFPPLFTLLLFPVLLFPVPLFPVPLLLR
jgi:hypothetical protein